MAAKAAKDARSLRGLIMSAPRMIASLKMAGHKELAEQVQDDLKQGLTGRRDLGEIITGHIELLHTQIPEERELMERLTDISQKNEAEILDDGLSIEENKVSGKGVTTKMEIFLMAAHITMPHTMWPLRGLTSPRTTRFPCRGDGRGR